MPGQMVSYYHPRPYSKESRVLLPLLWAVLISVAVMVIWLIVTLFVVPLRGGDFREIAGGFAGRAGMSMSLGLLVGCGFLIYQVIKATRPDVAEVQYLITPPDLDGDQQIDESEVAAVEYLFSPDGLVEFAARVFTGPGGQWGGGDWTAERLIGQKILNREMYDALFSEDGIFRACALLGRASPRHRPPLQAATPYQAEQVIRRFLAQPHSKIWHIKVRGPRGEVREVIV
jgi:hypothetical protein